MAKKLTKEFFLQDVLVVAPNLIGKKITRRFSDGRLLKYIITEVEAYRGEEDMACHARFGKTSRNEVMYREGGYVYVYLIYGMHWMLNFVTGKIKNPQAVFIRGIENFSGPGRLSKELEVDKSFYSENLISSKRIWIENSEIKNKYKCDKRIGIDYAGDYWKNKLWRFKILK
jgi:DNA-3-methyladenine glycosylase